MAALPQYDAGKFRITKYQQFLNDEAFMASNVCACCSAPKTVEGSNWDWGDPWPQGHASVWPLLLLMVSFVANQLYSSAFATTLYVSTPAHVDTSSFLLCAPWHRLLCWPCTGLATRPGRTLALSWRYLRWAPPKMGGWWFQHLVPTRCSGLCPLPKDMSWPQ